MIDDDPDFLHIMENWLSSSYKVDCSHSGAGALAYLDRKRPDLILLDYEMPGMNGEKVMQSVRSSWILFRDSLLRMRTLFPKDAQTPLREEALKNNIPV